MDANAVLLTLHDSLKDKKYGFLNLSVSSKLSSFARNVKKLYFYLLGCRDSYNLGHFFNMEPKPSETK